METLHLCREFRTLAEMVLDENACMPQMSATYFMHHYNAPNNESYSGTLSVG